MNTIAATPTADLIAMVPTMFTDATKLPEADARKLYLATRNVVAEIEKRTGVDLTVSKNTINSTAAMHFLGNGAQNLHLVTGDLAKTA